VKETEIARASKTYKQERGSRPTWPWFICLTWASLFSLSACI